MRPLSKDAEAKLLSALEKVAELVNTGDNPNSAIVKIAKDNNLPGGYVRLVVNAFNTGATNAQRESGETTGEKAADFTLADADQILDTLYPKVVKTSAEIVRESAVSAEYALSPVGFISRRNREMEKAAAAQSALPEKTWQPAPRDEHEAARREYTKKVAALREAEEARRVVTVTYQKAAEAMDKLADYFRRPGNCPFMAVKRAAEIQLGELGVSVLNKLAAVYPQFEKQASPHNPLLDCCDPIDMIDDILDLLDEYGAAQKRAAAYKKPEPEPVKQAAVEITTGSILYNPLEEPLELKKADASSTLPTGPVSMAHQLGESFWSGAGSYVKPPSELRTDAFKEITDPDHDRKLRNIRAQGVLADLVTNDPVISGHDPREVATAFNELAEIAPNFMDSTATVQALLRKRLEAGQLADFDIKQLAELEKIDAERRKNVLDAKSREITLI